MRTFRLPREKKALPEKQFLFFGRGFFLPTKGRESHILILIYGKKSTLTQRYNVKKQLSSGPDYLTAFENTPVTALGIPYILL